MGFREDVEEHDIGQKVRKVTMVPISNLSRRVRITSLFPTSRLGWAVFGAWMNIKLRWLGVRICGDEI